MKGLSHAGPWQAKISEKDLHLTGLRCKKPGQRTHSERTGVIFHLFNSLAPIVVPVLLHLQSFKTQFQSTP